ncbi:MAG TPA: cytochrome c-type biogenesis protein [Pseudomonadales bacterium]|nr:cytochrome c-type biogenesis protein [Pseudomonadales bacterium]
MKRTFIAVLFLLPLYASAAIDAYPFPNDQMRQRYNELIDELRCPQCLNTNIAGSDAMIAKDLRRTVHKLVLEGKTDQQILDYMHDRYGDFILYKPRVKASTYVLWFGPPVLFLIAAFVAFRLLRGRQGSRPRNLTESDEERLNRLLLRK